MPPVDHLTDFIHDKWVCDVTGPDFDEGNAELIQEIDRHLKKANRCSWVWQESNIQSQGREFLAKKQAKKIEKA